MISTSTLNPMTCNAHDALMSHEHLNKIFDSIFSDFDSLMRRHVMFHLFFIGLCTLEVVILVSLFVTLAQSLVLALSLSLVFFTFFAYFTLRIYFQTKKPEQFQEIKNRYLAACKDLLNYREDEEEHYKSLANACCKFANRLHAKEYNYYLPPSWLSFLAPAMERISCWWHWKDIYFMKEQMLKEAVNQHIKLVKCQPTNLNSHASLANAYVMLSGLYIDPRKFEGYDEDRWIPKDKYTSKFDDHFRFTAERAIEEFKILCEYAPDDPWVHSQLAYSYHDLQMPLEEIKEYEIIHHLVPADKDNLYKLGMLYFQQGMNAKGLRVYEELKKMHYFKAESLIKHYGSYGGIL